MTELRHEAIVGTEVIQNRTARRVLAVLLFALLTALGAWAEIPMPGAPTAPPVTLQTLFVTLAGVLLGPWLGAASQITYLAAGSLGAPVFAGGAFGLPYLIGPTGGYLLAFPIAAFVSGWLCTKPGQRVDSTRGMVRCAFALVLATALLLCMGAARLAAFVGAERAFLMGVAPFIAGDVLKIVLTVIIARRTQKRSLELF